MSRRERENLFVPLAQKLLMWLLASVVVAATLGAAAFSSPVQAQSESSPWNEPVNLSASGSASRPVIAVEPHGRIHVLWWDKFDGTKYTHTKSDGTWETPVTVPSIVGLRQRAANGTISIAPPERLVLMADGNKLLHALWINSLGDLMYARLQSGSTNWGAATRLVTAPLAWDVIVATDSSLNLAFIRSSTVGTAVPGVYFRRTRAASQWTEPELIVESLYFRTLSADQASVSVAAAGRLVMVAWNDPQLHQSMLAQSDNAGADFDDPQLVDAGDLTEAAVPQNLKLLDLPGADGKFLRLWEAGSSCALYQQQLGDDGQWSEPIRVLEKLSGCLRSQRTFQSADDGHLFMVVNEPSGRSILTAWDGSAWSEPTLLQLGFLNPATNDMVVLSCTNVSMSASTVVMIGCDQKGDVWEATSRVVPADFLPTVQSAWGLPRLLSSPEGDAGFPAITADQEGRIHVIWSQLPEPGNPGVSLAYVRGDGTDWSDVSVVNSVLSGRIDSPSILTDLSGSIHAVWSGGDTGEILYSHAFIRDALVGSDWKDPTPLPTLSDVGDSPVIRMGPNGKLHALYLIPFNEHRGVYYTYSEDGGETWAEAAPVFDAAEYEWTVVRQAALVVDSEETIHVAWSRAAVADQRSPLGVYYAHSTDGGVTWTEPLEVSAGMDEYPQIAAGPEGQVHLIWAHSTTAGYELWHQWSSDGGNEWSVAAHIPGLAAVAAQAGLIVDSGGTAHVAGLEQTREGTAAVFYIHWDGANWLDHDSVRLGYNFVDGMGSQAALSSKGQLSVLSRILIPTANGSNRYEILYVGRQLGVTPELITVPTFTPQANETLAPATARPTLTPAPLAGSMNTGSNGSTGNDLLLQIGAVAAAMILIAGVAVVQLWKRLAR